ncbi:MAG: hypothetical protein WCR72_10625 [Bacteroidota bacterium]
MRKLFDLSDLSKTTVTDDEPSAAMVEKFLLSHDHRIESIKNLVGQLPRDNEIFFLWTVKSFNAFTFIPFVIKETGTIDELTISTYSISMRIIDALMKLIDNKKVLKVHLLVSETLPYRLPKVFDHLQAITSHREEITVSYGWNHSKIALIHSGGNYLVVEGSGNFGENAQHEQYIFYNSQKVYAFRKAEINGIHTRTD